MENNSKSHIRLRFSTVVWCILAMSLYAAPCAALDIPAGQTLEVTSDGYRYDYLQVYGTANLLDGAVVGAVLVYDGGTLNMNPGASVSWFIYACKGSTVTIRGGQMGFSSFIAVLGGKVTVHGTDFKVGDIEWSASEFTPALGGASVLTGKYANMEGFSLRFYGNGITPVYLVNSAPGLAIDIKPGSDTNVINLKSNGVVPVAVLTIDGFSAAAIDPVSVRFAGAAPVHCTLEDVDGDGDEDMLFHFRTQQLDLNEQSVEATLTARLRDSLTGQATAQASSGRTVSGTDKVQILPSNPKK